MLILTDSVGSRFQFFFTRIFDNLFYMDIAAKSTLHTLLSRKVPVSGFSDDIPRYR